MKKINKLIKILSVSILMVVSLIHINAASGWVKVSGPSSAKPGESISFNIQWGASEASTFYIDVVAGGSISGSQQIAADSSGSKTVTYTPSGTGNATLSVSGEGASLSDPLTPFSLSGGSASVSISQPPVSKPEQPSKPAPSQPSPSKPSPSQPAPSENKPSEKPVQKTPEQIESDKKAEAERIEAEKKAEEEKKKEEEKNTPLIENIDIISNSDKMKDLLLETLPTEKSEFNYEYMLPRNVDSFKLSVDKVSDDVSVNFEEIHDLKEKNSIEVPIVASKGDITQTFKVTIKKNDSPIIKLSIDDKEMELFDDETLRGFMEDKGFKIEKFDLDGVESFYFTKDKVKLQLVVDEEFRGKWILLDDKNVYSKEVTILETEDDLFFVIDAPAELQKETLNGEKYSDKTFDLERRYSEFHPNLLMKNKYKAWDTADGQIVYGFKSDMVEGLFHNEASSDDIIKVEKAYVGFDQVDGKVKNIAIGSSVALLGLIPTNIIYYVINKKKENELI